MKKGLQLNLAEFMLGQLEENMRTIKVARSNTCKFGSLLLCTFFYLQNFFPSVGSVEWDINRPIIIQNSEFVQNLGKNFEPIVEDYFGKFNERMEKRTRIPAQLVEKFKDDICFLVDADTTLIKVVDPRTAWLPPMDYEIDIDVATKEIKALLFEPKEKKATRFGTFNEALKQYANKFFMKTRAFKILQGKSQEVDDGSSNIWTKLLSPTEQVNIEDHQLSIQAEEPINVDDDTIHILDTEQSEEETNEE